MNYKSKKHYWRHKTQCLFLVFLMLSFVARSQQNVIHTGERIQILSGTDLYIMGSFKDTTTLSTFNILNSGTIHIQGDFINNSTHDLFGASPTAGTLRFFGAPATNAQIMGNHSINIRNLIIDLDNPALSGNVLLRRELTAFGDISFLKGGFDLDTNVLYLYWNLSSDGIIEESDTGRALLLSNNMYGRISLVNFPWSTGPHPNIHGMGLSLIQNESLGGSPVLTRTFYPQLCGDSVGHVGSIERVYRLEQNGYNSIFSNAGIKFLSSELAGNPYGDSLMIFASKDKGQSWRQIPVNNGDADSTTSTNSSIFSIPENYTVITAATNPCDDLEQIHINQIVTNVIPNDTLFDISSIMVCDTSNVYARIYATGENGAFFEWRKNSNYYLPQDVGYYELNSLATYWVRMSNIRGCTDSLSIDVTTAPPVVSDISIDANPICLGEPVTLTPVVIDPTAIYEWDLGDGTISNSAITSHTYLSNGSYIVTLKATSAQNCMSSSAITVVVNAVPVADFDYGTACPGIPMDFINNTTVNSSPTLVTLNWDFGDGSVITSFYNSSIPASGDTSHVYLTGTSYNVSLTASANGCVSVPAIQTITVYPAPLASFSFGPACEGSGIAFSNLSSIYDSSPMDYIWDFNAGVGPTSTTFNPVYTYDLAGTHTVSLTATSDHGCSDDTSIIVTVYQNPVVNFNVTNACVSTPAAFADLTTLGSTPYSYSWNFGDGNTGTLANETNIYSAPGTFDVSLIVTTSNGCAGSTTHSVVIYPNPNVSFSALNNCVNIPINFINTSTNAVSYFWDFPTLSITSAMQNPTQTYGIDGTFPVYLTATSGMGCTATDTGYITIYPLPYVDLGTTIQTCGTSYLLDANPAGVNTGSTYSWSTGYATPQYNVTYNGNFGVTVTSPFGCISSDNVTVILNEDVIPALGTDTVFCDHALLDAGYPSPNTTYIWSTGANSQTIDVSVSGFYSVTVTDQNNCTGSGSLNITIVSSTPVYLGVDTTVCDSDGLILDAGSATAYLWSDGSTASTLEVQATGYYWVNILNGAGCNSSDTIQVTVNPAPVFSLGADQIVCDQLVLNAFSPNCSYYWNTGSTSPAVSIISTGTYSVTLTDIVTSCNSSDTVYVTVHPLPTVQLGNDTILCSYQSVIIDAGNSGSAFQWNSGQLTQTITVAADGIYEVVVTDINGCTGSDNMLVQVQPVFSFELGPDKQYCPGSALVLDAGLTTTENVFLWENSDTEIATTETYTVTDTGMYYLTVIDSYGCIARDSVLIIPSSTSLYAFFLSDSKILSGDTVMFVNLSHPKPYTSMWYLDNILVSNDSCPVIAFTMPVSPPSDTIYATLKVSNEYCVSLLTKPIVVDTASVSPPIVEKESEEADNQEQVHAIKLLKLYPNPNSGAFNLYIEVAEEVSSIIYISSIEGVMIYSEKRILTNGVISYNFDELKPGMYFLTVRTDNDLHTVKFIKTPN